MKKFLIMIPVYNDWDSLLKLLDEINNAVKDIKGIEFHCIVVNDASSNKAPAIKVPINIKTLKIINMRFNKGHARCNAFGVKYLSKNNDFDHLICMDGDGEDRPEEIKLLVEKAIYDSNTSVVAKRIKRSEGIFFQSLYQIHKILTIIFTGKNINFGNYSCLTKRDVEILSKENSLWSSFSGSVKKHISKLNSINSIRGLRYFGPSKMSLLKLIIHSLSIIAVFKREVFIRSVIFIIIISYIGVYIEVSIALFQFLIVVFNLLIFIVSLRENKKDFLECEKNRASIKSLTP